MMHYFSSRSLLIFVHFPVSCDHRLSIVVDGICPLKFLKKFKDMLWTDGFSLSTSTREEPRLRKNHKWDL